MPKKASVQDAAQLAPLVNGFTIRVGPPRTIIVPNVSRLAALQDTTVKGTLLKKQFVTLDPTTNRRTATLAKGGGQYVSEAGDGDLHFCLGVRQGQPHIACELQNAKAWVKMFNQARNKTISVSGFFRCMFEHPGFRRNDDAHIFEIHPVRAVDLAGKLLAFNVDIPEQRAIHTWKAPHDLNQQDNRVQVKYNKAKDTLTFTNMDGMDENYVNVKGGVSKVQLNPKGTQPASFLFTSVDIKHPVQAYCLQGTTAARQLRQLKKKTISMIALRNIDLGQALKNKYVINLLAIDIQSA